MHMGTLHCVTSPLTHSTHGLTCINKSSHTLTPSTHTHTHTHSHTHTHTCTHSLCYALHTVGVISGLQIAIAALGNFRSSKGLSQYDTCLNPDLQKAIKCTLEANQTISIPVSAPQAVCSALLNWCVALQSFGQDKEIYIYLFLFLTIYNFCLCVYAASDVITATPPFSVYPYVHHHHHHHHHKHH